MKVCDREEVITFMNTSVLLFIQNYDRRLTVGDFIIISSMRIIFILSKSNIIITHKT